MNTLSCETFVREFCVLKCKEYEKKLIECKLYDLLFDEELIESLETINRINLVRISMKNYKLFFIV